MQMTIPMKSNNGQLLFPVALRKVRQDRGLLQKTVAISLGVSISCLCRIERGLRGPMDEQTIGRAADFLHLSEEELANLRWAAKHDRLISQLAQAGATSVELNLFTATLKVAREM